MITLSDHQHLRSQIHEALKTMPRVTFAQKANVQYSKLDQFLDGQSVSDPTFRKLRSALPQAQTSIDTAVSPEQTKWEAAKPAHQVKPMTDREKIEFLSALSKMQTELFKMMVILTNSREP